jgi:hypothetical protein
MVLVLELGSLPWRSLRAAAGDFASVGSIAVHRWGSDYLVSNAAWMPGDAPVRTVEVSCPELPNLPRVFPPRFQWTSRAGRAGDLHWHGFSSFLDPDFSGDHGGSFIELHPPAGLCTDPVVDSWIDCTPTAAYHRGSGRPLARRDIGTGFEYRLDRGANSIQRLPQFVRGADPADLQSFEAEDEYHLCRAYMRALGRWRETGCKLARWEILSLLADAMLAWQTTEVPQTSTWVPVSLARLLRDASRPERAHRGGRIVRGVAWVLRLGAAGLEVGAPNTDEVRAWVAAVVRYVQTVQLDNGAFYSAPYLDEHGNQTWADEGEAWNLYGLGHEFNECPSWQIPFLIRALWEAQVQVPELHRRVVTVLGKAKQLWDDGPRVPDQYGGVPGLPLYLATAEGGVPLTRVTQGVGPARSMYDADAFAVFVRAGLLSKLPAQYANAGQPGITDDAVRVAAEFGTA